MRLWTIQPLNVVDELNKKGYFYCNPKLAKDIEDGSFKDAYDWLVKEMDKRLPKESKPNEVTYPIWAWYRVYGENTKPNLALEEYHYAKSGTKLACIEIEIPDDYVLLSDYGNWHFVLNDSYLDNSMNEEEFDKETKYFDNLNYKKKEKVKKKSWEKIFDINKFKNEWRENGYHVQATFWYLNKEWVKEISYFTCM